MDKGAHYNNCDFQVHTPRDTNWSGASAITDEERNQYAKEFVKACREKNIQAVAITDHHDIVLYEHIKNAAQEEVDEFGELYTDTEQLVVFPGMELTLSTPSCQAILLLDPSLTEGDFNSVLVKLSITPVDSAEDRIGTVQRIPDSAITGLNDIYTKLNTLPQLKGKYILLPNVNNKGGDTLLRQGCQEIYKGMQCIGGYVDGNKSLDDTSWMNKITGKDINYGLKSIAVVQTSDSRSRDFKQLGTSTSWIKWSKSSIEAIRQACLAQESRISDELPKLPERWIESIEISNSKFFGRLNLNLNRQYNSLIGGRGTGKSTILEYIRWTLYDDIVYDDSNPIDVKRKSILETLTGNIKMVLFKDGVRYVIKREKDSYKPLIKIGEEDFKECEIEFIKELFPIQSYSQKQLSSVSNSKKEISRLLNINVESRRNITEKIKETSQLLKEKYNSFVLYNKLLKDQNILNSKKESLLAQKKQLQQQLKDITPEQNEIINKKDSYLQIKKYIETKINNLEEVINIVNELPVTQEITVETAIPLELQEYLIKIAEEFNSLDDIINTSITDIKKKVSTVITTMSEIKKSWQEKLEAYAKAYKEIDSENTNNKIILEKLVHIDNELSKLDDELVLKQQEIEKVLASKEEYEDLKLNWIQLHNEKIEISTIECNEISKLSNDTIVATVDKNLNDSDYAEKLKQLFSGTRITEKCKTLIDYINNTSSNIGSWLSLLDELSIIVNLDENTDVLQVNTPILSACNINKEKVAIREKLNNDILLSAFSEELIFNMNLEYVINKQDNERIPFDNASAGQQATSLLYILLNQSGNPLIIDQPEDDIDSNAINDIINLIWKAKQYRQLIFVSHNANMVVNGDAELILCCNYGDDGKSSFGHIKCEGAIDDSNVKKEITTVMEGGEKAFKLRQAKYGF